MSDLRGIRSELHEISKLQVGNIDTTRVDRISKSEDYITTF